MRNKVQSVAFLGTRLALLLAVAWASAAYGNSCNDPCNKYHGCCQQSITSRCSNSCPAQQTCLVKVCSYKDLGPCHVNLGDQFVDVCNGSSYFECPQFCY